MSALPELQVHLVAHQALEAVAQDELAGVPAYLQSSGGSVDSRSAKLELLSPALAMMTCTRKQALE